tara:strand:+ start:298 stop:1488 length:1191 start_codon:yes stop_codon:yes gene_type:complete
MIADVWDESNALVLLSTDIIDDASYGEVLSIFWLHKISLDIYRPLASSSIIILAKVFSGDFAAIRYSVSAVLIAAIFIFSEVLRHLKVDEKRVCLFFIVVLFSSASLISGTWFANIFDVFCLFFLAVTAYFFVINRLIFCLLFTLSAAFSKEIYVLIIPLLFFITLRFSIPFRRFGYFLIGFILISVLYWSIRSTLIPFGTGGDIHGFNLTGALNSHLSFLAGFVFQSSKFKLWDSVFISGILALVITIASMRNQVTRLSALFLLFLSMLAYWGMFGFQADEVITAHNFIGRLYLIPFSLIIFFMASESDLRAVIAIMLLSFLSLGYTFYDHRNFQKTYLEIYELAIKSDSEIKIFYKEKNLSDRIRKIEIGNYPNSEFRIDSKKGGLVSNNIEKR